MKVLRDDRKAYEVLRNIYTTDEGVYKESYIFSFKQQQELRPHRHSHAPDGNRERKTWFLYPGAYIICHIDTTNLIQGKWRIQQLIIDKKGTQSYHPLKVRPNWLKPQIPHEIWTSAFPPEEQPHGTRV